jgi:cystathionine beta-lyase
MMFLDCTEWMEKHSMSLDELLKAGWDVGVAWQDGRQHGGTTHIRVNLALPHSRVKEAFDRLDRYVFNK